MSNSGHWEYMYRNEARKREEAQQQLNLYRAIRGCGERPMSELDDMREQRDAAICPIPDTYACQRCGRQDGLDAVLHDDDWARISEAAGGVNLLCLWCMDELALQLDIRRIDTYLSFCGKRLISTDSIASAVIVQRWEQERARADALAERVRVLSILAEAAECFCQAWEKGDGDDREIAFAWLKKNVDDAAAADPPEADAEPISGGA